MRALLIAAALFFSLFGGGLIYFALSGTGHEYDLKLVLPIDTRQMPRLSSPPEIALQTPDSSAPIEDGRAEAGSLPPIPDRPPVRFEERPGAASEAPPQN